MTVLLSGTRIVCDHAILNASDFFVWVDFMVSVTFLIIIS